jgi:hypothetical protein
MSVHRAESDLDAKSEKSFDIFVRTDLPSPFEDDSSVDGVFGRIEGGAVNYKNVGWIRAGILCMKCQIGLGVLGMPRVFSVLGFIPGILAVLAIGSLTTFANLICAFRPASQGLADR